MKRVIAITGGIGSGKSVVSEMLTVMGYDVYDCDSRAKRLMDTSFDVKESLKSEFGEKVIDANGNIDRPLIARIVFSDADKLQALNNIVHAKVREDLTKWIENHADQTIFFETAILDSSGLTSICNEIWEVVAPLETRLNRLAHRGKGLSREEALARIEAQSSPASVDLRIVNDDVTPILPQLLKAL